MTYSIVDVIRVLYRHRWLMAGVIAAFIASAVAYNYAATPIFEARARLLIEPNSPEVVPFRACRRRIRAGWITL